MEQINQFGVGFRLQAHKSLTPEKDPGSQPLPVINLTGKTKIVTHLAKTKRAKKARYYRRGSRSTQTPKKGNEPCSSFLWARRDSYPRLLLCDSKVSFSTASNTSILCVFVWILAFFRGANVH